ncbi:MAG: hypothetical protein WCA21_08460 [Terracidiphilus sp.]
MFFALLCDFVYPACRAGVVCFPFGADISIHFQLSKGSVESGFLDRGIGKSMILQLRAEVIAVRMALLFQQQQDKRLYKAVKISHAAGTRIIPAMASTNLLGHFRPPDRPASRQADGFTLSQNANRCEMHLKALSAFCLVPASCCYIGVQYTYKKEVFGLSGFSDTPGGNIDRAVGSA